MRSIRTMMLLTLLAGVIIVACAPTPTPTEAPKPTVAIPPTAAPVSVAPTTAPTVAPTAVVAQPTATTAAAAFDWKKYSGKTVRFIAIQGPWIDSVKNQIAKFETATGIKVTLETYPETQAYDKIRVELQGKSDTLDVFYNQTTRFGVEFTKNGWFEPLDKYITDKSLSAPDLNYPADFPAPAIEANTYSGKLIGFPTDRDPGRLVVYRKDLLQQYNIPVPTTFDELEAAAKKVQEASGGKVEGITNRGKGAVATSQFASVLNEFGGRWEDDKGNPTINTPEAIAAFDWWGRTLRNSGPTGSTTFDFPEVVNEFVTGKAAFTLEGAVNPGIVADPKTSTVAGKVGYAVIPAGPGGPKVRQASPCKVSRMFGLSMSAFSKNKEAGWLLIQWLASTDAQTDYQVAGRLSARTSAWTSTRFQDASKADKDYWDVMAKATQICYATPAVAPESITDQGRARDIIGQVIVTSILGQDVKAAAAQAQKELEALKARQ
jgi:multiple sugar transport system substrate-binding protein